MTWVTTMWTNSVSIFPKIRFELMLPLLVSAVALLAETSLGSETSSSQPRPLLSLNFEVSESTDWSLMQVGGAQGSLQRDSVAVSDAGSSNVMLLVVTNVGLRCGVSFGGAGGVGVKSNQWYDLVFRARTGKRENDRGYGLTVSLESRDAKEVCARTTIPEVGGEWREYTVALHARLANPKAVLVITMSEPGAIWFDDVSLKERQTGREARTP